MGLNPSEREIVGCALDFAGRLLGPTAPTWERLEALFQETLSALPVEEVENEKPVVDRRAVQPWLEQWQESLEQQTDRWAALDRVEDHATPELDLSGDPFLLDEQLRELMDLRNGWDATLGHLAMLMKSNGFWRDLGFSSFGHYCAERLGLSTRTVEQRVALERKLHCFPSLRRALQEGRVSYEKARIVADCARERTIEKWIARAEQSTCIELRRAAEAAREAQMCSRNLLEVNVPARVTALLNAACRAVRAAAGRPLTPGQCLVSMSLHFIKVWAPQMCGRSTPQRRARERDGWLCQVPGCSRPAPDAHHVILRSQGGGEAQGNLTGICAVHHLQGVHAGYITVVGEAPDRLIWELGVRPGLPPLWVVQTRAAASS